MPWRFFVLTSLTGVSAGGAVLRRRAGIRGAHSPQQQEAGGQKEEEGRGSVEAGGEVGGRRSHLEEAGVLLVSSGFVRRRCSLE